MITITPLTGEQRGQASVNADIQRPTIVMVKVSELAASWPEYTILEFPMVGKSKQLIKGISSTAKISCFEFPYEPEKIGKAQPDEIEESLATKGEKTPSGGHGGYLVTEGGVHHLPTRRNGKIDRRLMGAAWAALHSDYRGHKYSGPNKEAAIGKLRRMYRNAGMKPPEKK